MTSFEQINAAATTVELSAVVEQYLASIGQAEQSRGETYAETAARLGGAEAKILEYAENRWHALED